MSKLNQYMIEFYLCGLSPNKENFIFKDGEVQSNDRNEAVYKLNNLGIRVLQMNVNKNPYSRVELWLVEEI